MSDAKKSDPTKPEALEGESLDVRAQRLDALRALMPEVFTEGKVDLDKLRIALGDSVETSPERYGLTWFGKREAMQAVQTPSVATLIPEREKSLEFDTAQNVIIEGDNLEVLRLLQRSYYGKVKLIYIDPPYNTGKDFVYPDNFRDSLAAYLELTGQKGEEGRWTTNSDADGRYHSRWLTMMWPRLFLARNLLQSNGVLAVSIDDNELPNLRAVLDEIFGAENFVATIVWQKTYTPNMTAKFFSETHDYVVLYARNIEDIDVGRDARTQDQIEAFSNPDGHPLGPWKAENLSAGKYYEAGIFTITGPTGEKFDPPPGRYWRCSREKFDQWLKEDRIWFGKGGDGRPMLKKFLSEVREGLTPQTWWEHEYAGSNKEASLELKKVFDGQVVFDTPKPTKLLRRLIDLLSAEGDLILDFFAGSGTAAHAVQMTVQDGVGRRFILVQVPEPLQASPLPDRATIADVCAERARRVMQPGGLLAPSANGFRYFRLAESNFRIWRGESMARDPKALADQIALFADHTVKGTSDLAVLYEILLKSGFELTVDIVEEKVEGQTVYVIAGGLLAVCLEVPLNEGTMRAVIARTPKPTRVVVLDRGFRGNDQLKANLTLEFEAHQITFRTV